jgi:hypothetical protein
MPVSDFLAGLSTDPRFVRFDRRFTQAAKVALAWYILKYVLLDGYRHLRARGLVGTAREAYNAVQGVCIPWRAVPLTLSLEAASRFVCKGSRLISVIGTVRRRHITLPTILPQEDIFRARQDASADQGQACAGELSRRSETHGGQISPGKGARSGLVGRRVEGAQGAREGGCEQWSSQRDSIPCEWYPPASASMTG